MNAISAAEKKAVIASAMRITQTGVMPGLPPAGGGRGKGDEDLEHAGALDLLHRHHGVVGGLALALVGHPPEQVEHPAADRVVGLAGHLQAGDGGQLADGQAAGDAEGSLAHRLDQALLLVELVADLADELLEQILEQTRPAVPPYSSTTIARWSFLAWNSRSSASARLDSGTKYGG